MTILKTSYQQTVVNVILSLLWLLIFSCNLQAQYVPRITQIDKSAFPLLRVYVSLTDDKGNPIPDDQPVDLFLYEDGKEVSHQMLSSGWAITSVLVLDVSGSMDDPAKIEKAKEAAIRYVQMAGPQHEVALVVFSNSARVVSKIGTTRSVVTSQLQKLDARGGTALQDGIGSALDLLKGRQGRRVVVAMTDGIENNSRRFPGETGVLRIINAAKADATSIYIVGLGEDVNDAYLKQFEQTGGKYFFSPHPNQLKEIFERTVNLLAKEVVFEYTTSSSDRDGMTRNISVDLKVQSEITTEQGSYTKAGVIPHVRGEHLPYFLLCFFLLVLPGSFTLASHFFSLIQFRLRRVERLSATSEAIKKNLRDRNVPEEDEYRFKVGDLIVKCPAGCPRVYHVGSWRFTECHCVCGGEGHFCFVSLLPDWLRKALDLISAKHTSKASGRSFLCRCAGDADGY